MCDLRINPRKYFISFCRLKKTKTCSTWPPSYKEITKWKRTKTWKKLRSYYELIVSLSWDQTFWRAGWLKEKNKREMQEDPSAAVLCGLKLFTPTSSTCTLPPNSCGHGGLTNVPMKENLLWNLRRPFPDSNEGLIIMRGDGLIV